MFKSNFLIVTLAVSSLFMIFSCNSESSKNESNLDNENASVADTVVIRDTVFVSSAETETNSDSLDQVIRNLYTSVNATKMNVLYKGVDNPIAIKVPGIESEDVRVSISNGSIRELEGSGYVVNVKSGNRATIDVSIEVDEVTKSVGKYEFQVKSVPDPKPYFAGMGVADDKIRKNQLTAAQGVAARMENFNFDMKCTVTSFKLTMIMGGTPIEKVAKSNRLTGDMKTMLKKAKPGQKIYIEGIRARGPDGTVRKLGSIALKVI